MAKNEKQLQSEILKEFKAIRCCNSFKVSERFMAGIPDLYVCINDSAWIELKFEIAPKRPNYPINIKLSTLQRQFLIKEQRAGGNAGWFVGVQYPGLHWRGFVGVDPMQHSISQENFFVERRRGEKWQVEKIHEFIVSSCSSQREPKYLTSASI